MAKQTYEAFKEYLYQNHIPQREVGKVIGKNTRQINEKLNGHVRFSVDEIRTICRHFNISADEYFIFI